MIRKKSQSPVPQTEIADIKEISFPEAMTAILNGRKVRRLEWNNEDEYCLLKDNFLMIHRNNKFHAWIVSEGDMTSIDWIIM